MKLKFMIFVVAALVAGCRCRKLTRCDLTKELLRLSYSKTYISNWVCLIEQESGRDTAAVKSNATSSSYGLFQINSKRWCKPGKKGGECNMPCESFIDDDIVDDSHCANIIFEQNGFKYWNGWVKRCKNAKVLPDVEKCPEWIYGSQRSSPEVENPRKRLSSMSRYHG